MLSVQYRAQNPRSCYLGSFRRRALQRTDQRSNNELRAACKFHKSRLPQRRYGDLIVTISVFFFVCSTALCAAPKQQYVLVCFGLPALERALNRAANNIHLALRIRMYSYREKNSINGSIFNGELRAILCEHQIAHAALRNRYDILIFFRNNELNAMVK